ncbi:hydrogenase formation protein HypD [Brevibacillus ginsengisoli]|uniref:hydrogenase formation protein HypD n=1 Tax=Brevibacillus ginsengisoli TaxID=363854 RepID=UPI003CEB7770
MNNFLQSFSNPQLSRGLLRKIKETAAAYIQTHGRAPVVMEVCGSHTVALAKTGVKQALEGEVTFIPGPGCPVCVTDQSDIDQMIRIADEPDTIVCTFGDMLRVPGSRGSLFSRRSAGRDIRMVYNPMEAVSIAKEHQDKRVVLLAIGFETTMPIHAIAIQAAVEEQISNLSFWTSAKLVPPIMTVLLTSGETTIDGFLLPGHASIVLGKQAFHQILDPFQVPGVVVGFEPVQLLAGIYRLMTRLNEGEYAIDNEYPMVVSDEGNQHALNIMNKYFEPCDTAWRGIGVIPDSGLAMREEYAAWDAKKVFHDLPQEPVRKTACRCGEILRGVAKPTDCPLYAKACTPQNPIGPCMVSDEGACGAHYQYMREGVTS